MTTYLNTGYLHNHFVLNSVSFMDGKRYNDCKATYLEFRRLSDEICLEYGLSVVENSQKSKTPRSLYLTKRAGVPTRYNLMRQDSDNALNRSFTERFPIKSFLSRSKNGNEYISRSVSVQMKRSYRN